MCCDKHDVVDDVALDEQVNGEEVATEDELIMEIDNDYQNEQTTEQEDEYYAAMELQSVKYHKQTQTIVEHYEKSIQTNLAYDEALKPLTLLDMIHNDSDLQSWTGLPSFVTLNNIVKCVERISSAQIQLQKMKASTTLLTVFVMSVLKTSLSFKQLACLFALKPATLAAYFHEFIPILSAALQPAIFWPTSKQVSKNLPTCFKPNFSKCVAVMDGTEVPIVRLKSLHSRIKTYSHYKGKTYKLYLI